MTPPKTLDDVTITLTAEQDDLPVRGNAQASGDDALDRATEDEILARLDRGDVWAWASVRVRATWTAPSGTEYHGDAYLGGCSYRDEAGFREPYGYYDQMVGEAIADLNATIDTAIADLAPEGVADGRGGWIGLPGWRRP
jgi:hypothetical protein